MIEFSDFMKFYTRNAQDIFKTNSHLFLVDIDKETMWDEYLNSYPEEYNQIYRTRREMDCNCCKNYIRQFGNVVAIKNNKVITFWGFQTGDYGYDKMLKTMDDLIKSKTVKDAFVTKISEIGTGINRVLVENKVYTWNHFSVIVPRPFILESSLTPESVAAVHRDTKSVFERSLKEISSESVQIVLDMIDENQLYRGEEWKSILEKFLKYQKEYNKIKTANEKNNFCWANSIEAGGSVAKIKNHSIGTLLMDITDGIELETAVRKYESIVAPSNYKRPKAIFTAKMLEDAKKQIDALGFGDSLERRFATISDISVNNVLWLNRKSKTGSKSVFDQMKDDVTINPKKFESIRGISVDDFIAKLPETKSIEFLVENRHDGNFFSLIAPKNPNAKSMFKWNNGFSWAYNGNMADSMKQRVKAAGGKVDGILRFSIQWNTAMDNQNDYDAHCVEPNGNEIYFPNKGRTHPSSGILDVDIVSPGNNVAVENITYSDVRKMKKGKYRFFLLNYRHHGGTSGFDAEIEINGDIFEFSYHKDVRQDENINVAEVTLDDTGNFSITPLLKYSTSTKKIWDIQTNVFAPVSAFMLSPNYWDEQKGNGNKHYFFILNGCKNESEPNGFYNEYLQEDLLKHKKVFEALGSKMKVESSDNQLSGVGFSSTKRDYVIAKIDGSVTKIIF